MEDYSSKDGTFKLEVFKVQMEQKISAEEWDLATQVNESLLFNCNIGDLEALEIHIYPKGCDGCDECAKYGCDSVCVLVSLGPPNMPNIPDDRSTCLLWAGRFQKQGSDDSPVNLHDDKTWKIRKGPRPTIEDAEYGGHLLKAADILEHTINGFLVFKAEIQVSFSPTISFTHVEDRFFDQNLEQGPKRHKPWPIH